MDLAKKFEKGFENHTFTRIDPNFKVNINLGYNDSGNMSMIIIENGKDENVKSSNLIDVQLRRRADKKLALSFSLLDSAYSSMFLSFCKDIILVCENAGNDLAISSAITRWKYWKDLFGIKKSKLLEKQEIKGLIGELYVLKKLMIPKNGYNKSIKSWMGPLLGHKDFEIDSTWYEIKTTNDGAHAFTINSLEQLESEFDGHLVLVRIDETSESNNNAINLNRIVLSIHDEINDQDTLEEFREKLDNIGYHAEPEYDRINFLVKGYETFTVNQDFPTLKRKNLNDAIENAKYSIIISKISNFKE